MSVVDLHPEELLDRDARGELSPAESDRLLRHVERCDTCRLERALRADFRAEEDEGDAEFDVQRLLSEVLAPGADRAWLRQPAPLRRRVAARRLRPALLAAATFLVAGVSAAAGWHGFHVETPHAPIATLAVAASETFMNAKPAGAVTLPPPSFSVAPLAPTSPVFVEAAATPPAVAVPPITGPAPVAKPARVVEPPVVAPPTPRAPASLEPREGAEQAEAATPSALFEKANRARRAGDHRRAAELYRVLVDTFPTSAESHPSEALLGRLLLEDGEAAHALDAFDAYLRRPGPLEEDVLADRARTEERLGRPRDEAATWRDLLQRYPSSVHVAPARARLLDLEGNLKR